MFCELSPGNSEQMVYVPLGGHVQRSRRLYGVEVGVLIGCVHRNVADPLAITGVIVGGVISFSPMMYTVRSFERLELWPIWNVRCASEDYGKRYDAVRRWVGEKGLF